jgi:hypothetical protein
VTFANGETNGKGKEVVPHGLKEAQADGITKPEEAVAVEEKATAGAEVADGQNSE